MHGACQTILEFKFSTKANNSKNGHKYLKKNCNVLLHVIANACLDFGLIPLSSILSDYTFIGCLSLY